MFRAISLCSTIYVPRVLVARARKVPLAALIKARFMDLSFYRADGKVQRVEKRETRYAPSRYFNTARAVECRTAKFIISFFPFFCVLLVRGE